MKRMKKGKLLCALCLGLALILTLPIAIAEDALLQGFRDIVSENPDFDLEYDVIFTFQFPEGEDQLSAFTRLQRTAEPMATSMEFIINSFSSTDYAKIVTMYYEGEYVMCAWNDQAATTLRKRRLTEEMFLETQNPSPLFGVLANIAQTKESGDAQPVADASGMVEIAIPLTAQEVEQFAQEVGMDTMGFSMEVTATEPVDLLYRFSADTGQISQVYLTYPVIYRKDGTEVAGAVSMEYRFLQLGKVSPIEMPEAAAAVPFS